MAYDLDETIAAIASPPGGAARGIVRVSGPSAVSCVERLLACSGGLKPPGAAGRPFVATRQLRLDAYAATLPADLFVWPSNRSYTRQPTVEVHTFGSPPLLAAVLADVCKAGARIAKPGEFTMRAFLAGRLDLTQAEAVLGVIDAVDRRQLDAALQQMAGGLAAPLGQLRQDLLDLLADLEAGLDFADEDIRFVERDELLQRISNVGAQIDGLERRINARHVVADSMRVVLTGEPNVGKSSLFNSLVGRPGAIVSSVAGTTRDYVRAVVDWHGATVELLDTAGLDASVVSDVDRDAQRAASEQRSIAQIEILCVDGSREVSAAERRRLADAAMHDNASSAGGATRLVVLTKCDRNRAATDIHADVEISSMTGMGIDALRQAIADAAFAANASSGDFVPATAVRCRDSLRRAAGALASAQKLVVDGAGEELTAAEIRLALDELGQVVGAVYTDDLLDRVFSRFCIGK